MFVERRAHSHLRPPTHAPLDHASLPLDGFLPPWHHTDFTHAGAVLLVDRHECLHPMVARHCLKCQARKTPRLTVRWPIIAMLLPEGPGVAISVDYFGPLPVTPRGNTYILLITDRFSRRADMFPVTAAEFTAEGTGKVLVNKYIPLWGCPRTILSDNGPQFCSKLSQAV